MSVPDHRVDRRGRAQGGARLVSRGLARARRDALAERLQGAVSGRAQRSARRRAARRRPRDRRDHGGADGHRSRGARSRTSPLDSVRTLTATIAAELGETARGSDHYQALFAIGVLLFAITFVVNLTADLLVRGVRASMSAAAAVSRAAPSTLAAERRQSARQGRARPRHRASGLAARRDPRPARRQRLARAHAGSSCSPSRPPA